MNLIKLKDQSPAALCQLLGERLKQARLNRNLTQQEVANLAGVTRKAVIYAEKGETSLHIFVAILAALNLSEQLACFLPPPLLSPIQLAKLQGKKRQRASGQRQSKDEVPPTW